ncbi:hypothetical protein [Roseicyclus elongatus]|nr:hypothetical protein [Roseibacterium elongatum]
MSDTAKSSEEIEDVLSSIRRLVSDHHAPERSVDQPDTPPPPSEGADKLVLTPALRVTDPDDPWAPVPLKSDADDSPEPDDAWQPDDRLAVFDVVGAASEDAPSMPATEAPDAALGEAPEDAHGRRTRGGR